MSAHAGVGRRWVIGLGAGVVAGALDVALITLADPAQGGWVHLQSFLAWLACGAVAVAVVGPPSSRGDMIVAVLVTVLLNLAWYVALGPATGHPEHVVPLLVMSLVVGAFFGLARRLAGGATGPSR